MHDLDQILRRVWDAGVVLAGVSAGSICWFQGGTTDSFGPELRAVTNGLGFLPYGNGVHYDSEATPPPSGHRLVADGTLPHHPLHRRRRRHRLPRNRARRGRQRTSGKGAYIVRRDGDRAVEERLERAPARPAVSSALTGRQDLLRPLPRAALARAASMTASVCTASYGSTGMAACGSCAAERSHHRAVEVDLLRPRSGHRRRARRPGRATRSALRRRRPGREDVRSVVLEVGLST